MAVLGQQAINSAAEGAQNMVNEGCSGGDENGFNPDTCGGGDESNAAAGAGEEAVLRERAAAAEVAAAAAEEEKRRLEADLEVVKGRLAVAEQQLRCA